MTTYIEKLLHLIYPKGNWGKEAGSKQERTDWGRLWVHLFIGCTLPLIWLPIVQHSPILGLSGAFLTALLAPAYRELIHDKHPIKDLWIDTPEGIDCRSDILSCWIGSIPPLLVALIIAIL